MYSPFWELSSSPETLEFLHVKVTYEWLNPVGQTITKISDGIL